MMLVVRSLTLLVRPITSAEQLERVGAQRKATFVRSFSRQASAKSGLASLGGSHGNAKAMKTAADH